MAPCALAPLWLTTSYKQPRLRFTYPRVSPEVLKIHFARYLRGIYVGITCGIYTVSPSNIRQIRGNRCSFWWRGVVVSSNFVCGELAFLFILSLRPFLPPCACPSAAVFIATDHGCAHTDKCEMLLKISSRFC